MSDIIKITKLPETYRDPRELINNLNNEYVSAMEKDGYTHIFPNMDTRLHILHNTVCWCEPTEGDNRCIAHYADDKRHLYAQGYRKTN